jgi:hypothetical protein
MVYLYRAILADPATAKWLYGAMQAAQKIAADGTDQFFGVAAATRNFAIKQGWGTASADDRDDSIVNSTGYVDGGRYAIAILTEGHHNNDDTDSRGYNATQANVVTALARIVIRVGAS